MNFLILLTIIIPVLSGVCLAFSKIENREEIQKFSVTVLALTFLVTVVNNVVNLEQSCSLLNLPMGLSLSFTVDKLSVFFTVMFAFLSLIIGAYSSEYLKQDKNNKRFVVFYLITLGCVIGVTYANNPFTFYTFFEGMSLASFVLVLHNQTKESIYAAKKYIYYSIFGAFCALVGIMAFYGSDLVAVKQFQAGGVLSAEAANSLPAVLAITFAAILGFSCKADMFPLHSWIAVAYPEAPTPISALLSGVLAKTGLIAIIRIVFFVVGVDVLMGSWVQLVMIILSVITIFMGSMVAYREKTFKKRLAYSSVSQISYAIFGVMTLNAVGLIGAMLQMVFHALAKVVLFMCAGNIQQKTGKTSVDQIAGLGKAMPVTFTFFTIAGMSLVGVPLTGGFVSKAFLAVSTMNGFFPQAEFAGLIMIMVSALLTGGYILSVTAKALFAEKGEEVYEYCEADKKMLLPVFILVALIIVCGVYPNAVLNIFTDIIGM